MPAFQKYGALLIGAIMACVLLVGIGAAEYQGRQDRASWYITHNPAVNTKATISKAAADGFKHVCKGFTAALSGNNSYVTLPGISSPQPSTATLTIRDGATGAGTIMYQSILGISATGTQSVSLSQSDLYLVGSNNTALTIEFTAAADANTHETVSLFGESIPQ